MSYGKVHEEYWEGEKIAPLSDRAALLGLFLIAGAHRNAIGCFKLGIGAITDVERFGKWGIEGVSEALREMMDTGFIVRDQRTGWTFITNALVKDPIKGAKAAIHAAKLAAAVPANSVVYPALKAALEPQLSAEENALAKAEGWPMRSPIEGVSMPKPSPLPIQNHTPEPVPEPDPEPQPEPSGAAPSDAATPAEVIKLAEQPTPPTTLGDPGDIPDFLNRRKTKRRTSLTSEFLITAGDSRYAYAKSKGMADADIEIECEKFENSHKAKGSVMADWDAAWRTWCQRWVEFSQKRRA